MRIYFDNCCLNRPFDDQTDIRVKLETEAKLFLQSAVRDKKLRLAWSYMIDFENSFNPFNERRSAIEKWKKIAEADTAETAFILEKATELNRRGLKPKDALHVACAIELKCAFFLTTDDQVLKKMQADSEIQVLNPVDFVNKINL